MSKMAWLMRPPSKSSRLNLDSVKRIGPQKNDLMRAGVYILPQNWVFYKSLFGGVEFFMVRNGNFGPNLVVFEQKIRAFYKMDPVFFYKICWKWQFFINTNILINGRIYTPATSKAIMMVSTCFQGLLAHSAPTRCAHNPQASRHLQSGAGTRWSGHGSQDCNQRLLHIVTSQSMCHSPVLDQGEFGILESQKERISFPTS